LRFVAGGDRIRGRQEPGFPLLPISKIVSSICSSSGAFLAHSVALQEIRAPTPFHWLFMFPTTRLLNFDHVSRRAALWFVSSDWHVNACVAEDRKSLYI